MSEARLDSARPKKKNERQPARVFQLALGPAPRPLPSVLVFRQRKLMTTHLSIRSSKPRILDKRRVFRVGVLVCASPALPAVERRIL